MNPLSLAKLGSLVARRAASAASGTVLLVGAEPRIIAALARAFRKAGRPVVIALHSGAPAVRTRFVRACVRLPEGRLDDPALLAALVDAVRAYGCTAIVPCTDSALRIVAAHEETLRALVHVEAPRGPIVESVLEKDRTLSAALDCGIDRPADYEFADRAALNAARNRLHFPIVAKPRSKMGADTEHAFKLRYYGDFGALDAEFAADARFGAKYLLQEFCPGYGVGVQMLVREGEAVAVSQHRRLKEFPATGGVAVLAVSEVPDTELVAQSIELLRRLGWNGIAMVEWRIDPATGRSVLMEVNGRFWGSCALAIYAGVDYPRLLVDEWEGRPHGSLATSRSGVRLLWLTGDLQRVADTLHIREDGIPRPSFPRALSELLRDLLLPHRHALFRLDDPLPGLEELARAVVRLVIGGVGRVVWRMLPEWLKVHVRRYRSLEAPSRSQYLRRYWLRRLGGRLPHAVVSASTKSVLFVCHGNIMRSALAEALLRRALGDHAGFSAIRIASAGLHATPGRGADWRMIDAASAFGIDLSAHRAQALTDDILADADIVIVMDHLNEARLAARFPHAVRKIARITDFSPLADLRALGGGLAELGDPYHGGIADARHCAGYLARAVEGLATKFDNVR